MKIIDLDDFKGS